MSVMFTMYAMLSTAMSTSVGVVVCSVVVVAMGHHVAR